MTQIAQVVKKNGIKAKNTSKWALHTGSIHCCWHEWIIVVMGKYCLRMGKQLFPVFSRGLQYLIVKLKPNGFEGQAGEQLLRGPLKFLLSCKVSLPSVYTVIDIRDVWWETSQFPFSFYTKASQLPFLITLNPWISRSCLNLLRLFSCRGEREYQVEKAIT